MYDTFIITDYSVLELENLGVKLHPVTSNIPISIFFYDIPLFSHKLEPSFTYALFTQILTMTATY